MDAQLVLDRYRAGEPVSAVATAAGCTKNSVYRVLSRHGVRLRAYDPDEIEQLYREGMPLGRIASKTKASLTTIRRVLTERAVPTRRGADADRQERIVELYVAGVTITQICQQVGCAKSAVHRAVLAAGVDRRRPKGVRPGTLQHRGAELEAWYASGHSLEVIAARVGASAAAVRNVLLRRGVQMRSSAQSTRSFTDEEKATIRSLREAGRSAEFVSREIGCDPRTLQPVLVEMGLAARPRKKRVRGAGGYMFVRDEVGNLVLEHRDVMAKMLGRTLSSRETVHHIDGDITNNAPRNLQLRQGAHGKGVAMRCLDCGSHNVEAAPLNDPD